MSPWVGSALPAASIRFDSSAGMILALTLILTPAVDRPLAVDDQDYAAIGPGLERSIRELAHTARAASPAPNKTRKG